MPRPLRGASYSGYEFSPVQGFSPDDASGAQAGTFAPDLVAMQAWGFNAFRITLNQAAWLTQLVWDSRGVLHDPDPRRIYRSQVIAKVAAATALGYTVYVDVHWTAPADLAPMRQQSMADADNTIRLWTSLANVPSFKNNPLVIFELYNEPYIGLSGPGIKSGGTAIQVWKSGGVMAAAEIEGFAAPATSAYRQVKAMTLSGARGDFRQGSTFGSGAVSAIVADYDAGRNRLYYHSATGAFVAGMVLSQTVRAQRPMVGLGLPVAATSGTPANAVDADYNTAWRSSGAFPQSIEVNVQSVGIDVSLLGGFGTNNPTRPMLIRWHNPDTYGYDNVRLNLPSNNFNLPMDYTIDVNPSPSGSTGWVNVATVTGNALTGRQHLINIAGYARWRMFITAGRGNTGNTDVKINIGMWDAGDTVTGALGTGLGTAVTDGTLFVGDSITENAMNDINLTGIPTPAWGDYVFSLIGHRPPMQKAGMPGWRSDQWLADDGTGSGLSVLEFYLQRCPFKYVTLNIGSNDAGPNVSPTVPPATYVSNMLALAFKISLYGKIAIIPTIPWSPNAQRNANTVLLNNAMQTALAAHPEIIAGPDLYSYFQANPTLIEATSPFLHPTAQGNANYRTVVYGNWAATVLYAPTATVVAPDVGWPTAGMDQMIAAVRAAGANNLVLAGALDFSCNLSQWLANVPTDPAGPGKLGAAWHPYPPQQQVNSVAVAAGGAGYVVGDTIDLPFPNSVYQRARLTVTAVGGGGAITNVSITTPGRYLKTHLPTNPVPQSVTSGVGTGATFTLGYSNLSAVWSDPVNWPVAAAIPGAGYPLHVTEIGEHSYAGLIGSPWITDFTSGFGNANCAAILGWAWDSAFGWNPNDNVLIKDAAGTPSEGYGVTFKSWSLAVGGPPVARDRTLNGPQDTPIDSDDAAFYQAKLGSTTPQGFAATLQSSKPFVSPATLGSVGLQGFTPSGLFVGAFQKQAALGVVDVTSFIGKLGTVNWRAIPTPIQVDRSNAIYPKLILTAVKATYLNDPIGQVASVTMEDASTTDTDLPSTVMNYDPVLDRVQVLSDPGVDMIDRVLFRAHIPIAATLTPLQDFLNRSGQNAALPQPGVVWYHSYDNVAEVDNFRWTNAYGSGNDPLAKGTDNATTIQWISSGGADGGAFMRLHYPLGSAPNSAYWWRPFNAFTGAGNGRGVNDPGANGTIAPVAWPVSDGSGTTINWTATAANPAMYGHTNDVQAHPTKYQGTDFYVQVRVRRAQTPGKPPDTGQFSSITGKSVWMDITNTTSTSQEIVTYGQSAGEDAVGVFGRHKMYEGSTRAGVGAGGGIGGNNETDTINNADGVGDWRYSGGWDTLMYHITPGIAGDTGANRFRIEVWAQHDFTIPQYAAEAGQFTKIWDVQYKGAYDTDGGVGVAYNGWNALILAIYHNGSVFTTTAFNFDYDQVIFSKNTIASPQA